MSLSSASGIFATCCAPIKGITMRPALIYPYTKTRRVPRAVQAAGISWSYQFWADCTISMAGSEFPTGTARAGALR